MYEKKKRERERLNTKFKHTILLINSSFTKYQTNRKEKE